MKFIQNIFGSNDRQVSKLQPLVAQINAHEAAMKKLADAEIIARTQAFKDVLKGLDGDACAQKVEELLPEAFALTREASMRSLGLRHFDVQMIGGIVLHQGKVAEMKTGEGKTLTSTLPIYLNGLTGKGVHVVTVNDYLAKRDCNWMGPVYHALGLSIACITHEGGFLYTPNKIDSEEASVEHVNLIPVDKKEAYDADVTYGTNNEFGFDYLRDNMAQSVEKMVQRVPHFAIVDEVDSILIDEARTPLIISAPDTESTKLYEQFAGIVPKLEAQKDYSVDEKMRAVTLSDDGIAKVEKMLGVGNIYESGKMQYVHHLEQSLKAHVIFSRDKDYLVRDEQVIIIDDFTGRAMEGRRYSDGLHQAIEAKEGVIVQRESRTLATITFQNYFRMYDKLAGMTGTASTSAEELQKVYDLDVMTIPTHRDMIRDDLADVIYKTEQGKLAAIVSKISELHKKGQPVLVGTVAVEKSEALSALLKKADVPHAVLNAKYHEQEAGIITNAGEKGSVTIATNMAGRGTDIKLGDGVQERGGLYIIGTERHEARRIDDQLRGRSGRQGDPGTTQFYISLDDELMRRFGGDKLKGMMEKLGLPDDQPIQNSLISKQIEGAQSKIEGFNFDIRKHVLDYDDVVNKQREVVYGRRRTLLENEDVKNDMLEYIREDVENIVGAHAVAEEFHWNLDAVMTDVASIFPVEKESALKKLESIRSDKSKEDREKIGMMSEYLFEQAKTAYGQKEQELGPEQMRALEKAIALQTTDTHWMNHLDEIDHLRQGIGLRGYGQRDPLIEYKKEAFTLFSDMIANMRAAIISTLFRAVPVSAAAGSASVEMHGHSHSHAGIDDVTNPLTGKDNLQFSGAQKSGVNAFAHAPQGDSSSAAHAQGQPAKIEQPLVKSENENIGRNDPCYCGSGKKYKKCHMNK